MLRICLWLLPLRDETDGVRDGPDEGMRVGAAWGAEGWASRGFPACTGRDALEGSVLVADFPKQFPMMIVGGDSVGTHAARLLSFPAKLSLQLQAFSVLLNKDTSLALSA